MILKLTGADIMNTNRDLNYRLYLHKITKFERPSFKREYERHADICEGNIEKVRQNLEEMKKNYLKGKGRLSDDPVRNIKYHVIISAALVSRACINGGMPHDTAYTLSDIYIQRADKCKSAKSLIELLEEMHVDFTIRMKQIKKDIAISLHVRKCIDYIYEHLNEKLTLNELADVVGLNITYLSKLFKKETGQSIKQFVHKAKITTAENMLKYSDFSYSEIALSLGFSSQSAFTTLFKKVNGITPKKFRDNFSK